MFCGINSINLDGKGRMAIPARFRVNIKENSENIVVLTIDTEEKCLLLYPVPTWRIIENKIESLPSFNKVTRRIQRLLIGHATELVLDNNGRILLPPLLRDYAGLSKKVILVGQGRKFEIWDDSLWHLKRDKWLEEGLDDSLPEELSDLSL